MARLDGLGEAQELARLLSVIGREASFDLLRAVSEFDDTELESGLDRLVEPDLVRRRHAPSGTVYVFKHWLVQDVAYESLLRSRGGATTNGSPACCPTSCPRSSRPSPSSWPITWIALGWTARRSSTPTRR